MHEGCRTGLRLGSGDLKRTCTRVAVAQLAVQAGSFGEMERVWWCLSVNSRPQLLDRHDLKVVETLVWTVKS
jgi:hypothetical protein